VTAPFAPPPSRSVIAVLAAMLAVMAVIPFARREDWLGWIAFGTVIAANVLLWGLLAWGVVRRWNERIE
jgi:hypothetical protein